MKRGFALVGIGAALGAAATLTRDVRATGGPEAVPVPAAEPRIDATYNPTRSFAPLVEAVEPAVVAIEVEGTFDAPDLSQLPPAFRDYLGADPERFGPQVRHGEGSGFLISADGLLLTNHHVIDGARTLKVRFSDGTEADADVLGSDPSIDVALLKLRGDRTWPFVELGTSKDVEVGDWVLAVGNPLGLGTTVTAGIISGKGRALGHDVYDDYLQTDAAINEGNSGGPLFDLDGNVIGINTAIIAGANTIGFAIPIDLVEGVLDDLQDHGHVARGYIGVRPTKTADGGALVAEVIPDTPAAKAGLRPGDRIVKVDDQRVEDPVALVRVIGTRDPGERVRLLIVRDNGKETQVEVQLAERPVEEAADAHPSSPSTPSAAEDPTLGLSLDALTSKRAGALDVAGGVEVTAVEEGSPAYGFLRAGDVVLEVNHWAVRSPEQIQQLVSRSRGSVLFQVLREGSRRYVSVPLR